MSTYLAHFFLLFALFVLNVPMHAAAPNEQEQENTQTVSSEKRIQDIQVHGNRTVSTETILNYLPYRIGGIFDRAKTRIALLNVYNGLKRFKNISISVEDVSDAFLIMHVDVVEKYPLVDVKFAGNHSIGEKELREKIDVTKIPAIDELEAELIAQKIKELYLQKGYHTVSIDTALEIFEDRAHALFTIHEGKRAVVKQIHFIGNNHVTDTQLRTIILTKEDWILSFLDHAGYFHKDKLEADKYFIQQYYKNIGHIHAHVTDVSVSIDDYENMILTYSINEGDCYHIKEIQVMKADSQDAEPLILDRFENLIVGDVYSLDLLRDALNRLENFWKNQGYIFAHAEPMLQIDEDSKQVSIKFHIEKGEQIIVNKITVRGNKKTRRKVILRNISAQEGTILTQYQLDRSQYNVESLGYFDQDSVQWKMRRLDQNHVDLELMVKEGRTGHLEFSFSYGGDLASLQSPIAGFAFKGAISDSNLFGYGINAALNMTLSRDEQGLFFHVAQPWLFDRPIYGACDVYHKRPSYTTFHHVERGAVNEKLTGGTTTVGYMLQTPHIWLQRIQFLATLGFENVAYNHPPRAANFALIETAEQYQRILDQEFNPGKYVFLSLYMDQDLRNHPMHTSRGHRLRVGSKSAFAVERHGIGFYKFDIDFVWFTPLIGDHDLVFRFRGYAGVVQHFKNKTIPFGELFQLGGQSSIRGFEYGQAGPQFQDDPIGGRKGLFVTADFIIPVLPDQSMKVVLFYNGGAGFDNPYAHLASKENIRNNNFDYRHAVGFGVRLLRPTPMSIDWGFKIDPRKNKVDPRLSETGHEVHFSMSYDF